MRRTRRAFGRKQQIQAGILAGFLIAAVIALSVLMRMFYVRHTETIPVHGGTYIEGSVGAIRMLNPWLTVSNDVNKDITSLVFSGLQRYNPFTGMIENDMASLVLSGGNHIYTLTLKNDLYWHDSTEELPRPVTADDVVFTYLTIQQPGFPNPILQKNFRGIDIEKIDDRTVQFRLEKPYHFFRSNLTLGILPRHRLAGIPPERIPEALDFNFSPVGSGPYRFKSMVETELATEVTLESWDKFHGAHPFIDQVVFRSFPDYPSLLSDLKNLNGVRHVPRNADGRAMIPGRYEPFSYSLPQYVALFFNMDRQILQDRTLRLGLQLATNKQEVAETINETVIIDTPLLEIRDQDWQYRFDPNAGMGALFDSDWHLPQKVRLQHLLEQREVNMTGALKIPHSVVLLQTGALLTLTGSMIPDKEHLFINDIPVRMRGDHWLVDIPTDGSSGSLVTGVNVIKLTESGGKVLDSYFLTRTSDPIHFKQLREEEEIVEAYSLRDETLTINDLRTDNGILRKAKPGEAIGIRTNDKGQELSLTILTSTLPPSYPIVANTVADMWKNVGINAKVEVLNSKEFEDRVISRDYDVLLFGQPLLDNLDSYPYWHSSQTQISPDSSGSYRLEANNLSQYTSFQADALLEQVRETHDADMRKKALELLKEAFANDIPAVVLYSPTYVFAVSNTILGVDLGSPSTHSDRFLGMHRWFIRQGRSFRPGYSWAHFPGWLTQIFSS